MATCILLGIDSGTPQVTSGDRSNVLADINDSGKQRYASICMVRRRRYIVSYFIIYIVIDSCVAVYYWIDSIIRSPLC